MAFAALAWLVVAFAALAWLVVAFAALALLVVAFDPLAWDVVGVLGALAVFNWLWEVELGRVA